MDILYGWIIPVVSMLILIWAHSFFERGHLVDIIIIQAAIEFSLIAHAFQAGKKVVRRNVDQLHEEILDRTPELLDTNSQEM